MDNLITNVSQLKGFTLDDDDLLSTYIELIKWFDENKGVKGVLAKETYIVQSEYLQTYNLVVLYKTLSVMCFVTISRSIF